MWGASLADFAKKAQTASLFNLDAMLGDEGTQPTPLETDPDSKILEEEVVVQVEEEIVSQVEEEIVSQVEEEIVSQIEEETNSDCINNTIDITIDTPPMGEENNSNYDNNDTSFPQKEEDTNSNPSVNDIAIPLKEDTNSNPSVNDTVIPLKDKEEITVTGDNVDDPEKPPDTVECTNSVGSQNHADIHASELNEKIENDTPAVEELVEEVLVDPNPPISDPEPLPNTMQSMIESTAPLFTSIPSPSPSPSDSTISSRPHSDSHSSQQEQEVLIENNNVVVTDSLEHQHQHQQQQLIEKFMGQMERLNAHHQTEFQEMEKQYSHKIDNLEQELSNKQQEANDVNHSGCKKELRRVQKYYKDILEEYCRKEEVLTNELASAEGRVGTVEKWESTVKELENDKQKIREEFEQKEGVLHNETQSLKEQLQSAKKECQDLTSSLQLSQSETQTSQESFNTLKGRVKAVATELKERRLECRELHSKLENTNTTNQTLQEELDNLNQKHTAMSTLVLHKTENEEHLEAQLNKVQSDNSQLTTKISQKHNVSEKTLLQYKKKAQGALSSANSRAASAILLKEEMELEITRLTKQYSKMEYQLKSSEEKTKQGLTEKEYQMELITKEMENMALDHLNQVEKLEEAQFQFESANDNFNHSEVSRKNMYDEILVLEKSLEKEKERSCVYSEELKSEKERTREMRDNFQKLKEEYNKSVSLQYIQKTKEADDKEEASSLHNQQYMKQQQINDSSEVEILGEELKSANEAIAELKEALHNALTMTASTVQETSSNNDDGQDNFTVNDNNSNDQETPTSQPALYFALEKQAELQTARDEMNRLANLLSDTISSEQTFKDLSDHYRQEMEEVQSKLDRISKFQASDDKKKEDNWNLEYLKHVILKYMMSTSIKERRGLVPVISAVLCLTEKEMDMVSSYVR